MTKSLPHTLGLTLGTTQAVLHLVWSLFVAVGWAGSFMSTVYRLHMVDPSIRILPFDLVSSVMLIVVTALVGYAVGWLLGTFWNVYHR